MGKTLCEKCNKEIRNCNFKKHFEVCGNKKNKPDFYIKENWKQINGKYKCPFCEKEFVLAGIAGHIWRKHGNGIKHKCGFSSGNVNVWNKGLTKENDERIKKSGIKNSLSQKGKTGRKVDDVTKAKISEGRRKWLEQNPDKVPYLINHSSKESYPEKLFREALIKDNITGWVQEYQNGIYRYDFAFIDLKIDVEIDGATHTTEKVKKIDKRRDEWSKRNGWKICRFFASDIKNNIDNCINTLKDLITQLD